ncbi:MAG: CPBP family intramembrane metalloprotease [Bifidobacteriaceae bacterium]|nr:CPBP family intramembrane metalloprotease [Bifidobacteriaceae bacterium]
MRLYRLIYDPASGLRQSDLLGPDQPFKPYPLVHRIRFNAGLRAVVFAVALAGAALAAAVVFLLVAAGQSGLADITQLASQITALMPGAALVELVGAVAAYIVLTSALEARRWPSELAWRRIGGLFRGMALGFILITFNVGLLAIVGAYRITGFNPGYSPWADLIMAGLTAGVAEELIFRGVAFRLLEDTFGTVVALAASSVLFGAMHLTNPDGTLLGGLGIALATLVLPAVYVATRSLWWPIGLHFAWNIAQGPIWGSVISGSGGTSSMLRTTWKGPVWLTGGEFGIEASVVVTVTVFAFSVWLLVMAHRSGNFVAPSWTRRRVLNSQARPTQPATV